VYAACIFLKIYEVDFLHVQKEFEDSSDTSVKF
jgi:hypothetical protein